MSERWLNYLNGRWVPPKSGLWRANVNPADRRDVIGEFPVSDARDVQAAVRAAQAAFEGWRLTPAPRRGERLFAAAQILADKKEVLAKLMTREMGKVLRETRGDVQEAVDTGFYAAGEGRRLFGDTAPVELPNKQGMCVRVPVGVCGMITPWNFPMAIPSWKIFPALICGNTCVIKTAEDTPASVNRFVEALAEAGVPPGVVNVVHGDGPVAGQALVQHPGVALISFTGSVAVGRLIAEQCGRALKRCSLELGGKNAQIVLPDADLTLAVEGALWGAFGTTGQRCTATSRVILHRRIKRRFTEMFVAAAKEITIGNGLDESVQMGPLINEEAVRKVERSVALGRREKARLLLGGRRYEKGECRHGHFFAPTIFDEVHPKMRIAREEIFGPVVCLFEVDDLDEALAVANGTDYGLSASIFSRDVNAAFRAVRDLEAGICYVNGPTIGAEVQFPFGGVKNTGNGHREAGRAVLDVFTEWKSIYVDFSGALQRAQIDR